MRLINVLIEGLAEAKKAEVNQIFFHDFLNKNDALFDLFSEFLLENTSNCTTFEGNCKVHFEGRGRVNRKINIDRGGTTTFPLTVFDGFVARKDAKEAALAVKNAASASSSSTTMVATRTNFQPNNSSLELSFSRRQQQHQNTGVVERTFSKIRQQLRMQAL